MCWITKEKAVKMVADKDIKCFKIVRKNFRSVFFYKQYILYKTETDFIEEPQEYMSFTKINHGIHSYGYECDVFLYEKYYIGVGARKNESDLELFEVEDIGESIVLDCIIPKGSSYYKNEYGLYVSDAITPVGVVKTEDFNLLRSRNCHLNNTISSSNVLKKS